MNYWLVKSEPFKYSWDTFVKEQRGTWDGVRNYQARNNLQAMREGDLVLFYHSSEGLAVVGIAKVAREQYPDPSTDDPRWVAVDLVPLEPLPKPVTLVRIKSDIRLQNMALVRHSRLSVSPVRPEEFDILVGISHEID
ncbi:MAG: EVE domain-containing protein [Sphingobacteriaceae bacterium]|nr:EVE domain-containing protein [Cytophagaceae bacterium]